MRELLLLLLVILISGCITAGDTASDSVPETQDESQGTGGNGTQAEYVEDSSDANAGPSSILLGGTEETPVYDYTKSDYENALASGDLVVLYFYANWCPTCRAEVPRMYDAFDEIEDGVTGIRINFNDGDTDDDEKALAKQYGIAYQHTKVLVKDGEVLFKSVESWSKQRYLDEIARYR